MLWSSSCFAYMDLQSPSFERQLGYSDVVAVVEITNMKEVAYCGTLVTANVVKSFKEPITKLQFWVQHPADLIDKRDFYFIMDSYEESQSRCPQSRIRTSNKEGRQTLFAFAYGYHSQSKKFILANRQSFLLSSSIAYGIRDKGFEIFNGQIYAVGRWEEVLKIIEKELPVNIQLKDK